MDNTSRTTSVDVRPPVPSLYPMNLIYRISVQYFPWIKPPCQNHFGSWNVEPCPSSLYYTCHPPFPCALPYLSHRVSYFWQLSCRRRLPVHLIFLITCGGNTNMVIFCKLDIIKIVKIHPS